MIKYAIYCYGKVPQLTFSETLEEAKDAFDKMTILFNYNNHLPEGKKYLTCAEMGVFTLDDFEEEVIDQTDQIWCLTFEDYVELMKNSFEFEYNAINPKNFKKEVDK